MMGEPTDRARSELARRITAWIGVLVAVALGVFVRVDTALSDPNFDVEDPSGMLKSDPALLYYFTERIVAAGGGIPDDFRADPRVQHPGTTDVLAEFTVGQELLVAWAYRAFAGVVPLHVFCTWFMAFLASLAAVGVYLFARERTGSVGWGLFAAALFALLPASYRTIGFVLIREDLSFPLFALHLGLLARALRVRTWGSFLVSSLALGAAFATWHAMGFVASLGIACLLGFQLATGARYEPRDGAWAVLVGPVLAGVLVPALRANLFLLSLPMILLGALAISALVARRAGVTPALRWGVGLGAVLLLLGLRFVLARFAAGASGYDHVSDVVLAKLVNLGSLPDDPGELSFDARLLWQGPFNTLDWRVGLGQLGFGLALPVIAWVLSRFERERRPLSNPERVLLAFFAASLPVAWLFERMVIVAGLSAPIVAAVLLARLSARGIALAAALLGLLIQSMFFVGFVRDYRISWYVPPGRQTEIASLVRWVDANVPAGEPIVGDFVNSTAILAYSGHPIALQPKYETDRSRRRAEEFLVTFFQGTAEEMRTLVRERFQSRYVIFDRVTLWYLSRYTAGIRNDEARARPGTAAELFLSQDATVLESVPGFELVYRSPITIVTSRGTPYDYFRLYRVED